VEASRRRRARARGGPLRGVALGTGANPDHVVEISREGVVLGTFAVGSDPQALAIDASGNIWVGSQDSSNITELSPVGSLVGTWAVGDPGDTIGIAIDGTGNAWAVNFDFPLESTIVELNPGGMTLGHFGVATTGPWGVAIDSQNNVWISGQNAYARCGDAMTCESGGAGTSLSKVSSAGDPLGSFTVPAGPTGIAVDSSDDIWVASTSGSVTKLSNAGVVLVTVKPTGTFAPFGVAVDSTDRVWVTDEGGDQLTVLTRDGTVAATYTVPGLAGGMTSTSGVALDRTEPYAWVANYLGKSVTRFGTGGPVARCRSGGLCP